MNSRTIVITGGNTGIGKAIAIELSRHLSSKIVIVSRDLRKGESALNEIRTTSGNNNAELITGDLSEITSTKKLAETIINKYPEINVLINNAGVWKTRLEKNMDGLEISFMVNHLAPFILSNALLETLKKNAPSRIVNVNAGLYFKGKADPEKTPYGSDFSKFLTYANSKLCNVLFTRELSRRIANTGVSINAVHPGVIRTNLGNSPGLFGTILRFMKLFWKTPAQGAIGPSWLAVSPDVEGVNGKYFMLKDAVPFAPNALDEELTCRVWELSEKLSHIE